MNIAITGANGFIAKNLILSFKNLEKNRLFLITRTTKKKTFEKIILKSDIIYHLAGVNRPIKNKSSYNENLELTDRICKIIENNNLNKKIIFSSSIKILKNNCNYGVSKKNSEKRLKQLTKKNKSRVMILRLPNIFGKWSRPNYNSVVSTFCYNVSRKKKIFISDKKKIINLLYIDDLIKKLIQLKTYKPKGYEVLKKFSHVKTINLINLSKIIKNFEKKRNNLYIENLNNKFINNLYSTYISFLPKNKISYKLNVKKDHRGSFVEFLKSANTGQISIFSAKKNKIRGHHFHHSKVEKFLVIKGKAQFILQSIYDKKKIKLVLKDSAPKVVESIPGWIHYIKNIGNSDLLVLLWSNEVFDVNKSDTFAIRK